MDRDLLVATALRHRDSILAVIVAMVQNLDVAEDLMQETMVEILRSCHRFDDNHEVLPWAKAIARNVVRQSWRENYRRREYGEDLQYLSRILDSGDDDNTWDEERAALRSCMELLGERARKLLQLRYDKNMQGEELARAAGLAPKSLANTLMRIRRSLQRCIGSRLGCPRVSP